MTCLTKLKLKSAFFKALIHCCQSGKLGPSRLLANQSPYLQQLHSVGRPAPTLNTGVDARGGMMGSEWRCSVSAQWWRLCSIPVEIGEAGKLQRLHSGPGYVLLATLKSLCEQKDTKFTVLMQASL